MCGRYTLSKPEDAVAALDAESAPPLEARYNIAPTDQVPVVRARRDTRALVVRNLRWGLVPFWAKDLTIGYRMINARSETLASKPAFRDGFVRRRCGVLADGFYEWRRAGSVKQPFHIKRPDGEPFVMAGLWDRWKKGPDGPVDSFTIVTVGASDSVAALHDRMPVILDRDAWTTWLDPRIEDKDVLTPLLTPYVTPLTLTPVSRFVNKPGNDTPACIEPIDLDPAPSNLEIPS